MKIFFRDLNLISFFGKFYYFGLNRLKFRNYLLDEFPSGGISFGDCKIKKILSKTILLAIW